LIGERDPYRVNMTAVLEAAERTGTAMEINAHPSRLDLADVYVRKAKELGSRWPLVRMHIPATGWI